MTMSRGIHMWNAEQIENEKSVSHCNNITQVREGYHACGFKAQNILGWAI